MLISTELISVGANPSPFSYVLARETPVCHNLSISSSQRTKKYNIYNVPTVRSKQGKNSGLKGWFCHRLGLVLPRVC